MKSKLLKQVVMILTLAIVLCSFSGVAYADEFYKYSKRWYTTGSEAEGNLVWHINDEKDQLMKNVWICDYESAREEKPWYLIDENGDMVVHPIVQDGEGYYYAINDSNHNGTYGNMLHGDDEYYGVNIQFNQNHDGHYGAIVNQDAIKKLSQKYGVKQVPTVTSDDVKIIKAEKKVSYSSGGSSSSYFSNSDSEDEDTTDITIEIARNLSTSYNATCSVVISGDNNTYSFSTVDGDVFPASTSITVKSSATPSYSGTKTSGILSIDDTNISISYETNHEHPYCKIEYSADGSDYRNCYSDIGTSANAIKFIRVIFSKQS